MSSEQEEIQSSGLVNDEEVESSGCVRTIRDALFPGQRSESKELRHELEYAPSGWCVKEGPEEPLTPEWLISIAGLEGVQYYLWLGKDWSWSQITWVYPGLIFGCLSLMWMTALLIGTIYMRMFADFWLTFGMLLWLLANFWWMVGEFWSENFIDDDDEADLLYARHLSVARVLSTCALVWQLTYFLILRPCNIPADDRRNPILVNLNDRSPRPRFPWLFRDFRDYENLHLLLWTLKDCMWIWGHFELYVLAFVPTFILSVDIVWIYATHKACYVDFAHSFFGLLWVCANGVWAMAELLYEEPSEDAGLLTEDEEESFSWPYLPHNSILYPRYVVGWMFFIQGLFILLFYIQWSILTCQGKIIPQAEKPVNFFDGKKVVKIRAVKKRNQNKRGNFSEYELQSVSVQPQPPASENELEGQNELDLMTPIALL